MSDRIRVLTVDDHPLLREGITAIINSQSDMSLVAQNMSRELPGQSLPILVCQSLSVPFTRYLASSGWPSAGTKAPESWSAGR